MQNNELGIEYWEPLRVRLKRFYRGPVPAIGHGLSRRVPGVTSGWLILKGAAELSWKDGKSAKAKAGQWLFPKNEEREQTFAPGTQLLSLRIMATWPSGKNLFSGSETKVLESAHFPHLEKSAVRLERFLEKQVYQQTGHFIDFPEMGLNAYAGLQTVLMDWVVNVWNVLIKNQEITDIPTITDERIRNVIHALNQWPLDQSIDYKHLCTVSSLSRNRMEELFKASMHCTARHYLDKRRLESAYIALEDPTYPIKNIAFDLGFKYVSHFTAWFRNAAGQSPSAYREKAQEVSLF